MEKLDLFEKLYIKGIVYAFFSEMGPEPMFLYPLPMDLKPKFEPDEVVSKTITERDYMQVAVKSISLLMSDYNFSKSNDDRLQNFQIFGMLPYPDISMIGFTLFSYYYDTKREMWMPVSFTILVEETHRHFIYDSMDRIKSLMNPFHEYLRSLIISDKITSFQKGMDSWHKIIPKTEIFISNIKAVQTLPISPITSHRRIKILFTGLEDTGKTSFLLTIKRKFSSLPSLVPSTEAIQNKMDFLGTTIIKLDIPGSYSKQTLKQSALYLHDSDMVYFCINIQNPRLPETKEYLNKIITELTKTDLKIPIVFIITKVDEDIAGKTEIKKLIFQIQHELTPLVSEYPHRFFSTSIFSLFSILNAFSFGLRQLSPNREMLKAVLSNFLLLLNLKIGLLLNENGIVLASAENENANEKLPEIQNSLNASQIFEIAAPQFTSIASQFHSNEKSDRLMKYEFSPQDLVVLKPFAVNDFPMFALFYSVEGNMEEVAKEIKLKFPKLQKKVEELLQHYIN